MLTSNQPFYSFSSKLGLGYTEEKLILDQNTGNFNTRQRERNKERKLFMAQQ